MKQSTRPHQRVFGPEMTLANLVHRDHRLSSLFERYGLTHCCNDARSLAQVCAENGLDIEELLSEIDRLSDEETTEAALGNGKIRDVLSTLYYTQEPRLQAMVLPTVAKLQKIAHSHGSTHSQTIATAEIMDQLTDELLLHLARGKQVLLPRVDGLLELRDRDCEELEREAKSQLGHLRHELAVENRVIQRDLAEIRELTSHYRVPDGVCKTFTAGYRELAAFDELLSRFLAIEGAMLIPRLLAGPCSW